LQALGYVVQVPALPDTDSPVAEAWTATLGQTMGPDHRDVLLVGHSLGALAALHWVANAPPSTRLAGLFVVAPPLHATGIEEVDRFLSPAPLLDSVRTKAGRAAVLVSDNDPYLVPDALTVAKGLAYHGFETLIAPGKAHFSPASGLKTLPELTAWAARLANMTR
jgi:predicted alpha/beta hydrolase family esterase